MEPVLSLPAPGALAAAPRDQPGAETLEIMAVARRYNLWQYSRIAPFLGRCVCEIGSGIGNMSALLTHHRPDLLLLTDADPYYRDVLHQKFLGHPGARVEAAMTLPDEGVAARFGEFRLDTVLALNVIEEQLRLFDALVPVLRLEDVIPLPFGQSFIAVGVPDA